MSLSDSAPSLLFLGEEGPAGIYLLRFHVTRPLQLSLGRLRAGELVPFDAGPYLYTGSALAVRGGSSLARRLLRHATRTTGAAHPLQRHLTTVFPGLLPPQGKRLHWHIDYLLDEPSVVLTGALLMRTSRALEGALAAWLIHRPFTTIPAAGAGASDAPGKTHILGVSAYGGWWADLCRALTYRFAEGL